MMRRWISGYRALLLRGSSQRAAGAEQGRRRAGGAADQEASSRQPHPLSPQSHPGRRASTPRVISCISV